MKNSTRNLRTIAALLAAIPMSSMAQTAASGGSAGTAGAAPPGASRGIEEVVVTAQKRAENIQDVPLSIQAVSGDTLADAGILSPLDLGKLVPSLNISNTVFGAGVAIRIRGFGTAGNTPTDSEVATYLDGAYVPRPGAVLGSFLDVKNVEVLSGPQGTLFGRNATMGAISLNSNAPSVTERTFEGKVEGATFGTYTATGVANFPVTENIAVRAAVTGSKTDGVFHNNLDGRTLGKRDQGVGRISGLWDITPELNWTVRVDAAHITGDGSNPPAVYVQTAPTAQLAALQSFITRNGGSPQVTGSPPSYSVNQYVPPNINLNDSQSGVTSDLSWSFSPDLTARLINSYRDWRNAQLAGDTVSTSLNILNILQDTVSTSQSHELQLISSKGAFLGRTLGFASGLYYFREAFRFDTTFNIGSQFCSAFAGGAAACLGGPQAGAGFLLFNQVAESRAAYVQANYAILPTVEFDLGVRRTFDKKSANFTALKPNPSFFIVTAEGPKALALRDNNTSYRGSLSWHVTDMVTAFATYATGYKSGGFNGGTLAPTAADKRIFASETVDDVEVGVKTVLLDRRLRLNATLFNTKLKGFQDRSYDGVAFITRNAGDVRSRGVDLDGEVLVTSSVKVNYGLTYLNSIYTNNTGAPGLEGCTGGPGCPTVQDLTGKELAFAPKWHGNIGAQWDGPAFMGGYNSTLALSENFTSSFLTANTDNPQSRVFGYGTTDLRVSFYSPDNKWQLDFFGTNIFDRRYFVTTVTQTLGANMGGVTNTVNGTTVFKGFLGDPRRYGIRLSAKF